MPGTILWVLWLFLGSLVNGTSHPAFVRSYDFVATSPLSYQTGLSFSLDTLNRTFDFQLEPNHADILLPNGVVELVSGSDVQTLPLRGALYSGIVKRNGLELGWVRLTLDGASNRDPLMDGVFSTPEGMYHIKSIASYKIAKRDRDIDIASPLSRHASYINSKHILIKEADMYLGQLPEEKQVDHGLDKREALEASAGGCGFKLADQVGLGDYFETLKMQKREEEKGRLFARAPAGCPSSRKTLVMAAAADCAFVNAKGGSVNALNAILANWNAASKIFESTFNIALALVKVQIEQQCTPNEDLKKWNQDCSSDYTISNRLSDFSRWRGAFKDDGIGLWHLMTRCGTQPSVGIAWLGKLCSTTSESQRAAGGGVSYVSGTGVSSIVPVEWKVVAHEIGHGFGATHDCVSQNCPCSGRQCDCCACGAACDCKGQFLMHPLDSSVSDQFSPCTIDQICSQNPVLGSCLVDSTNLKTIQSSICGNGVKEANEECDCGTKEDCDRDACCEFNTCKLKAGQQCDDRNDACCSNCKLRSNGTVCRPSIGVCDTQETCDGTRPECPNDIFLPDRSQCTTGSGTSAQCASGQCTSRDLQCRGRGIFNSTRACAAFSTECQLFCQDEGGLCLQFNGVFVDGTPCGESGTCIKGQCTGTNFFAEAVGWYKRNLAIAVPVTVIIGGLILASLYSCIANCYRKKRQPPVPVIPARAPGYPGNASRRSARLSTRQSSNPPRASQQPPPPPNNPQWSLPSVAPTSPIYAHTAPDAVYNPQLARVDSSTMGESYPLQPMHLQTRHSGVHETVRREERDLPPAPADTSHWVDPRAYNGFG